jgi:hypothetical protein
MSQVVVHTYDILSLATIGLYYKNVAYYNYSIVKLRHIVSHIQSMVMHSHNQMYPK